jgi:DNA-directed RNA polymerase specialized sigma24 family protein
MEQSFPQGDRSGDDHFREAPRTEYQKRLESGEDARSILTELYRDTQSRIFRLARGSVRNAADADEIVQEVFVKMQVHFTDMITREPLWPWIRTVTINALRDWARRRAARGGDRNRSLDLGEIATQAEREAERRMIRFEDTVETWVDGVELLIAYMLALAARGTLTAGHLADFYYEVAEGVTQRELAIDRRVKQSAMAHRKRAVMENVRIAIYLCEILGLVRPPWRQAEIRAHLDLFDLSIGLTATDRELLRQAGMAVSRGPLGRPVLRPEAAEAAIHGLLAGLGELHEAETRYAAAIPNPAPDCIAAPCALHTAARG